MRTLIRARDESPQGRWREQLPELGVILLMSAVPLLALRPLQNVPFVDDWVYAWSVQHLLRTGDLRFLDWAVSQNIAQVLWGSLFCAPFGFSFTALRLSTWVASLGGLLGLHALLRELGVSRADRLVGVAMVAFYPVYFILSYSFMTDVPFVATMIWFFAALARALKRHSPWALAGAVLCACLAVSIRPVGVVLSGVLLLTPWPPSSKWSHPVRRLALAVVPLAVLAALLLARPALTEHRADLVWIHGSWAWRGMANVSVSPAQLVAWLATNVTFLIGILGVALTPLALGSLSRENARAALPGGLLVGAIFTGELLLRDGVGAPLDPEFTWSLRELGATEALVPPLTTAPVRSIGWALGTMFVATLLLALALAPVLRRRPRGQTSPLAWGALGYVALSAVLWLFYDRYALPLVVIVAALRLGTAAIPSRRLAVAGVAMFIAISGVGTWDHLQYSRALWNAVAWARQAGIQDRQLDGGYVVNGWLQYAHPEHAARGPDGDVRVPDVNWEGSLRYRIVKRVPPGARVLHAAPYRRIIAPSGSIYVVDRTPGPAPS